MGSIVKLLLLLFVVNVSSEGDVEKVSRKNNLQNPTDDYGILVISTLDGSLTAVDKANGNDIWMFKDDPAIKVSATTKTSMLPVFLPDPKDGSLYLLNNAEHKALKKLPLSIQQLVAKAPCKSSDGVFYSGKKVDTWFSVDINSGKKLPLLGFDDVKKTCPLQSGSTLFLGRTEYNLLMIDSKSNNGFWNITYSDYASHSLTNDQLKNYGYNHFTSISSGRIKTIDRKSGALLWEKDFKSPIVGIYLRLGQDIFAVPFHSIAETTLDSVLTNQQDQLMSTLYIGEGSHGLYALPSLADRNVPLITDYPKRLLISGPDLGDYENNAIILGHYLISSVSKTQLLLTGKSGPVIQTNTSSFNFTRKPSLKMENDDDSTWNLSPESKILGLIVCLLIIFMVAMFFYIMAQVRDIKQSSHSGLNGSNQSGPAIQQKGNVVVGKISFNTQHILGKGCEGTFVFRGTFEGRSVAVKRLLPDCFTVADREVQLLRESDAHPHVIRYFSTEEDFQFKYIALELCSATLQDFVEKDVHKDVLNVVEALKQAISGLEHLHSLNIVHRDIKPHNILLATVPHTASVKVMISDFGLCKKLQNGKVSFSKRSGITGTDGWIAPEMMNSNGRVMCAVDIFSMGCVFYYSLVNGKHPFGEPMRRQSNIVSDEPKISALDNELWKTLIVKMISYNPHERPSANTVLKHPVFWSKSTILSFLQDISDRVEKEDSESKALISIETGGSLVCMGNWKELIDSELSEDLGKYRSYRGDSVRDLLRAFRNKKHHYRELTPQAQELLGTTIESYVDYWLTRCPRLLFHSWSSMQFLRSEPGLSHYYDPSYTFPCDKPSDIPHWFYSFPSKKNSPKYSPQKNIKRRPKTDKNTETDVKDADKEAWINSGKENNAWRPGVPRRRETKKTNRATS